VCTGGLFPLGTVRIGTECLQLYVQGNSTFAMRSILKVQYKTVNKGIKSFFEGNISHSPRGQMLEVLRRFVLLLRNSSLR
jgi:hypothetical protein